MRARVVLSAVGLLVSPALSHAQANQGVPVAYVVSMPVSPDSAVEMTRGVLRYAGDTPVDISWQQNLALLSTRFTKNSQGGPGMSIVFIAAEVARRTVNQVDGQTATWVRVRGWVLDSVATRRDINAQVIQNNAPQMNRTLPLVPADSAEWSRVERVVAGLEKLGGRVIRRPER